MNTIRTSSEPEPFDRQQLLDLLVDGELDAARRRELLSWCRHDPEGWRRCALAFLEAQSWRQELGAAAQPRAVAVPAVALPAARTESLKTRPLRFWIGPLAMAASFLLAFSLGLLWRGRPQDELPIADHRPVGSEQVASNQRAEKTPHDQLAGGQGAAPRPLANVRLVVDGPQGASQEFELPVMEGGSLDELLAGQGSAIPAEVQRAFERLGHRVRQRRQLVPFELEDGRRLIVPVDEVDVHPVGDWSFQ
ncbi:MAG: hypothetical protein WD847_03295 [Pirellulales bacterium]